MDPLNAIVVAQQIAARLAQLDAAHASDFKQHAKKFADEINAKLPEWQKSLEAAKGQKVITYHRSFPYFIDRFDLVFFSWRIPTTYLTSIDAIASVSIMALTEFF